MAPEVETSSQGGDDPASDQATYTSSLPATDPQYRNHETFNNHAISQPYISHHEEYACDPMTSKNLASHNAAMTSAETTAGGVESKAERERLSAAARSLGFELSECWLSEQHRGKTPLERWLDS